MRKMNAPLLPTPRPGALPRANARPLFSVAAHGARAYRIDVYLRAALANGDPTWTLRVPLQQINWFLNDRANLLKLIIINKIIINFTGIKN